MPTSRLLTFLSAALVLYLFANQTQVGWLYVMSALLAGIVLAAWWLSRGMLKGVSGKRQIEHLEVYEGDTVHVSLTLAKEKGSSPQLSLNEVCPLAAPDSPQRSINLFIPQLPSGGSVAFEYDVLVDRRGVHEFAPLTLTSRAPFGFFKRQRPLSITTRALVYPEVRPLKRLDLLDKQIAPEVTKQRAGFGYEVIGVRPYRTGDSVRHIHWRSVARSGQLISKEFADEAQPGLSMALDLYGHPFLTAESKHAPFEWMVKIAASIADYARVKGYPLHILADSEALAVPDGPVSWSAVLQYLARIQPTGKRHLNQVIGNQSVQASVAAVFPWPDPDAIESLLSLMHRRANVLAIVIDPASFPAGGVPAKDFAAQLENVGIATRVVEFNDDWASQLSEQGDRARRPA